jgi:hypothetical protein
MLLLLGSDLSRNGTLEDQLTFVGLLNSVRFFRCQVDVSPPFCLLLTFFLSIPPCFGLVVIRSCLSGSSADQFQKHQTQVPNGTAPNAPK